jgi:hypothetical protein
MTKKITELTKEQQAKVQEYYDQYYKLGTEIKATDKDKARDLVIKLYKLNGFKEPKVIFTRSPHEAINTINDLQKNKTKEFVSSYLWGNFDLYWICFYRFIIDELKATIDADLLEKFNTIEELSKEISYWYPYEEVVVISTRHTLLSTDEFGQLHNLNGPSLQFEDGYSVYAVHGVRVPAKVITHTNDITIEDIEKEDNAEVRRVMIDLYGAEKYLLNSDFEVLDEDKDQFNRPRRLLRKEELQDSIVFVEVTNSSPELDSSYKKYYLPVHPELKPLLKLKDNMSQEEHAALLQKLEDQEPQQMTCHNAVASTFGLRGEEYGLAGQIRQGDVFIKMKSGNNLNKPFSES